MRSKLFLALVLCLPGAVPGAQPASSDAIRWQPHEGVALDGSPLPGELGRIRVPENRRDPNSRTIELAFVRFRTTHPNPGPPIFFLAGGPGGSGVEGAAAVASHPQIRLLEHSDVIGLDQRGTGSSRPNLMRAGIHPPLPFDRPLDRETLIAGLRQAVARTVDHWRRQGVDLPAYNTAESADDLDALRQTLGLRRIVLYGSSYGSHLGLAYLRRHGEHVARAVLAHTEGPDHTWKLPSTVQRHLEHLHRLTTGDPALGEKLPDLRATLKELLDQLAAAPVLAAELGEGEPGGDEAPVAIGPLDLQIAVSRALASVGSLAELPADLYRFSQGDWSPLAAAAREHREVDIPAMTLMMDCSSGATAKRLKRIEREAEAAENLLGDAILAPFYPAICEAAGRPDLGDAFRGPLASDVPVLFVSGTLDVRTPPENVEEILDGFPRAVHLVIENAGHEGRELMSREYRQALQAFLRGDPVTSSRITLPEPIFTPVDSGPSG